MINKHNRFKRHGRLSERTHRYNHNAVTRCRRMSESRRLTEGPGAGYIISWEFDDIKRINNARVTDIHFNSDDTFDLTISCDVDIDIVVTDAHSYYYGIEDELKTTAKITKLCILDVYDAKVVDSYESQPHQSGVTPFDDYITDKYMSMSKNELGKLIEDELYYGNGDYKFCYGGGYSHCTYDGQISDMKTNNIEAYITDEDIISYIDDSVAGNFDYPD